MKRIFTKILKNLKYELNIQKLIILNNILLSKQLQGKCYGKIIVLLLSVDLKKSYEKSVHVRHNFSDLKILFTKYYNLYKIN